MKNTLPDSLDYVRVEYQASRLGSEAICARAVSHYDDSDADMAARHKGAVEALTSIATLFGYELRTSAGLFSLFESGFASGTDFDADDTQTWEEAAREAFSIERPELAEKAFAAHAASVDAPILSDDVEPRVTLPQAAEVWKGFAHCALMRGDENTDRAEADFRSAFPRHAALMFKAPALALAGE